MLSDSIRESIIQTIEDTNPEAFLVDMSFKRGSTGILHIKLDTDKGISLSECSKISRKVGYMLEEEDLIKVSYRLEVSSPGIGTPLKLRRQYKQNIGRYLKVVKDDHTETKGKLVEVDDATILLEPVLSKKKNSGKKHKKAFQTAPDSEIRITFKEIKEAKVIII